MSSRHTNAGASIASPSDSAPLSRIHRPELESLRGIAMLLVFWFHVDAYVQPVLPPNRLPVGFWHTWVRAGHSGVDLFFILSSFLLSLPFLEELAGGPHVDVARYARRRILRIGPAYWVAVFVATLACARGVTDLIKAIPHLFFVGIFSMDGVMFPYSAVWWSLSTEVQLYAALPVIAWWRRPGWRGRAAICLLVGLLASHVLIILGRLPVWRIGMSVLSAQNSILGRGPTFLVGIAAAEIYRRHGAAIARSLASSRFWRSGGSDLALWGAVLALWPFLQWATGGQHGSWGLPRYQAWHTLVGGLWAIVLLILMLAPLRSKRLVVNPFLDWCGKISYSVYLVHAPFMLLGLNQARGWLGLRGGGWSPAMTATVAVLTVGCFALSALTYRFIELPFLRRKETWSR